MKNLKKSALFLSLLCLTGTYAVYGMEEVLYEDFDYNKIVLDESTHEEREDDDLKKSKISTKHGKISSIIDAVRRKNSKEIKALSANNNINASIDSDNNTALHIAAQTSYFLGVKTLIDCGANITMKNSAGHTPLDIAKKRENESETNKKLSGMEKKKIYWIRKLLERAEKGISGRGSKTKTKIKELKSKESYPEKIYEDKDEVCSICIGSLSPTKEEQSEEDVQHMGSQVVLHCGHVFHKTCIEDSKKHSQSCPICKKEFTIIFDKK